MDPRPKILVIDDEEGVRDMLHFALEKEGFTVLTAKNGEDGLKVAVEEELDLVITDIKMPGMNGIMTLERIKAIKPDIEVIMATGYGTMESAIESLRKGSFDYIHKPFNLQELLAMLAKAMETRKLKQQLVSLAKLDKMKDEILTLVAHELKTPLTVVSGSVDLLIGNFNISRARINEILDIMHKNVHRIRTLIDAILDFSKLEAGLFTLVKVDSSVLEMMNNSVEQMLPLAEKAKIKIIRHQDLSGRRFPQEDVILHCDPDQIERVLENILANAVSYTPENGRIAVWFEKCQTEVKWVIEDNGRGLAKENLDKVFDKFFRADNSLTRKEYGLGLGLSICKKLIELHQGNIWAESEGLNCGSKFNFVVPLNI